MRRGSGPSTYARLLEAAWEELCDRGFKATRLQQIAARAGVTKGALYHHFPDKRALALTTLVETMGREIDQLWLEPLASEGDPLPRLDAGLARHMASGPVRAQHSLPELIANLTAEDPAARLLITERRAHWRKRLAAALARARHGGFVHSDIDCDAAALFILSAWEGCRESVRYAHPSNLSRCSQELLRYIAALRGSAEAFAGRLADDSPTPSANTRPGRA